MQPVRDWRVNHLPKTMANTKTTTRVAKANGAAKTAGKAKRKTRAKTRVKAQIKTLVKTKAAATRTKRPVKQPVATKALTLDVQFGGSRKDVPSTLRLQRWAEAAYRVHHAAHATRRKITPVQVSLRIVGAAESRKLNYTWRDKDYATNVLSFPMDEWLEFGGEAPSLGDLAICAPVVKREAKQQGKPLDAHWAHMVIHGVLHLLGYDHEVERDAQVMEACEVALLDSFGFGNPYADDWINS